MVAQISRLISMTSVMVIPKKKLTFQGAYKQLLETVSSAHQNQSVLE